MHLLKSTSGEPDFRCLLPAACRLSIATVCCALCAGAADVRPPWLKEPEPWTRGKAPSVTKLGFGWGKGGDHANSANPFHNCKGFTFNACTFDDCDNNK